MNYMEMSDEVCNLCPRECHSNRVQNQSGYCRQGANPRIARAALHMWEEPCISGNCGSGAIFFSGCSLRCIYCQNEQIAAGGYGKEVSVERLAELMLELQEQGAANINLVTPDHFLLKIREAVLLAREQGLALPIVYNCSGYAKVEAIEALAGIVDIFLTDFKYMDTELSRRFSHAEDYPKVAKAALDKMVEITGAPVFDQDGMMKKGVIVRHLLLPGHKRNAKAVLQYVYESYGDRVTISLMNQYTPFDRLKARTDCIELTRKVTKREYEAVVDYMLSLGVQNAFIQEGETAKESFIPAFDGAGVENHE